MPDVLAITRTTIPDAMDWRVPVAPGGFTPVGVMLHHTVSGANSGEFPSRTTVTKGRGGASPLPPPLCNHLVGRDAGRVGVVTDGRAYDSGMGSGVVLNEVRHGVVPAGGAGQRGLADTVNGNPWFYDVEIENDGVGEPFDPGQWEAALDICEALCRHHGWSATNVIGHYEWTRRKIDPQRATWDMAAFRAQLAVRLGQAAPPAPPPPAPRPPAPPGGSVVITVSLPELRLGAQNVDVSAVQSLLNIKAGQGLVVDGDFGARTDTAVKNWQRWFKLEVDGIVGEQTWKTLLEIP